MLPTKPGREEVTVNSMERYWIISFTYFFDATSYHFPRIHRAPSTHAQLISPTSRVLCFLVPLSNIMFLPSMHG